MVLNELAYEIKSLSYSYLGRFAALNDISLQIKKSEKVALLGANGSGKSTLLFIMAGLIFPDKGTVEFFGKKLNDDTLRNAAFQSSFRGRVGIIFQNSEAQLFNSSVDDEILFGLEQIGLGKDEISKRIGFYKELIGIESLGERHPQYLSIGEKKRVAIASVLAMEPEVLLLDEPTAGLDPRTARHLIDTIAALGKKGCTVITATQDIHIVPEIADRVIVLNENKQVAADAATERILSDTSLLQEHNLIHSHAHKHKDKTHIHPHEHPLHEHTH